MDTPKLGATVLNDRPSKDGREGGGALAVSEDDIRMRRRKRKNVKQVLVEGVVLLEQKVGAL